MAETAAQRRARLRAAQIALAEKTAEDFSSYNATPTVDTTTLRGIEKASSQAPVDTTPAPYVEEFPTGMPDIAGYVKATETGLLPPGILKPGFTEGPLPEEYQKILGNPDILGWRVVTDENGTQRQPRISGLPSIF